MAMVEVTAVGEDARIRYRAALGRFTYFLEEGRTYSSQGEELPADTARFAIGGATSMIFDEVRAGRGPGPAADPARPGLRGADALYRSGGGRGRDAPGRPRGLSGGAGSDAVAVPALAGGEAGGAAGGDVEGLAAEPVLEREALGERQAGALDRGAAVGEHRLLREGGDPLGQLEGPLEVARRGRPPR